MTASYTRTAMIDLGTDYGGLVERLHDMHDRVHGFNRANGERAALIEAADAITALKARVEELETALRPFSDMAGEMFARNWNDDHLAIALDNPDDGHRLFFRDFRRARRTLTPEELDNG